jgi:DnaJ-class molecular chaperone
MAEAPKCRDCDGWGVDREKHPLTPCETCGGTGRPAKPKDLVDG